MYLCPTVTSALDKLSLCVEAFAIHLKLIPIKHVGIIIALPRVTVGYLQFDTHVRSSIEWLSGMKVKYRMQHTESVWPMYVSLKQVTKQVGRWTTTKWEMDQMVPATEPMPEGARLILLELHRDQRGSYRINLDMDNAMLYIVCDELSDGTWVPAMISADQNVGAGCLESDTPVFNVLMPKAIACWIEAFITRHGEVEISAHRRKHVNRRTNDGPSANRSGKMQ